jgi:hypothetical protein
MKLGEIEGWVRLVSLSFGLSAVIVLLYLFVLIWQSDSGYIVVGEPNKLVLMIEIVSYSISFMVLFNEASSLLEKLRGERTEKS